MCACLYVCVSMMLEQGGWGMSDEKFVYVNIVF